MPCTKYPFRYIVLGICRNENTGHVQTIELARGRGDSSDDIIQNVLLQTGASQYDRLLLISIGPALEESGASLNLRTEVICVTPPPAYTLKRIDHR